MNNTFDDTQPYVVSDLEQAISTKSSNSTSMGYLNTTSVPQKRCHTSDCLTSLLNINDTRPNCNDRSIRSSSSGDDDIDKNNHSGNNNHNSLEPSSLPPSGVFGIPHNSYSSPYDTDHSHDPYTSDSWSSQHEEDSLSDIYDDNEGNKYGSAADPIHYIPVTPRRKFHRKKSTPPAIVQQQQQQELEQSPFTSSHVTFDNSDSDSDGFGTPTSSSSHLPPQPLNFIQQYHQQQQQQQQRQRQRQCELSLQNNPSIESRKTSLDWGNGNESDATASYDVAKEGSDELDKNTQQDKAILYDKDEVCGSNDDDQDDTFKLFATNNHPEQSTAHLSTSNDWQLTQRSSNDGDYELDEGSAVDDYRSYSDHIILTSQAGDYYSMEGGLAKDPLEAENHDQMGNYDTLPPSDDAPIDTQLYDCKSSHQTHNQDLSFNPCPATYTTGKMEKHNKDNGIITNTNSHQKLQQSSLDEFFSQIDSVSTLSTAKSLSDVDGSDNESDLRNAEPVATTTTTTTTPQGSLTSLNGSIKTTTQSSLDYLRVEKIKNRSTQSPKEDQHWLTNPKNLTSSPHSKPDTSPPQPSRSPPESLTARPRRRLPGLSKPRDSSYLSSSVSAPSIATMLSTREQYHNETNLRPTNIIVKSSSSFSVSPRRKKTLGMSRHRIY